jgi:hypothetical protein
MLVKTLWVAVPALLLLLAGAAWMYFRQPVPKNYAAREVNQDLDGALSARLELDPGAAILHLEGGKDDGHLIVGRVEYLDEVERLEQFVDRDGSTLVYKLRSVHPVIVREPARWPQWNLKVNPRLPLSLTLHQGMPESSMDLRGLRLTRLEVAAPVGKLDLSLPEQGRLEARITGGMSRSVVHVSESTPLRVSVSGGGLGSVEVFGKKIRPGAIYERKGFANSADGIDLEVVPGIARVSVEEPR